jgi:predicted phosphodiesterase
MQPNHLEPPLLVFGGPYSNLRAVLAMRKRAGELGMTGSSCICTGDVVAYCAEPKETILAIRDWGCHVIAGNCEEQLAAGAGDCGCGFEAGTECDRLAKGWYEFANARISAGDRAWMASLPKTFSFTLGRLTFRVVHGGVDRINRFVFRSQRGVIADELRRAEADIVIAGHCGIPFIESVDGRWWFNPGVIGMPANDGTSDTWFGLIERRGDHVVLSTHRLAYDHHGAAATMRRWGHTHSYARCLLTGLWPSLDVLPAKEKRTAGIKIQEHTVNMNYLTPEATSAH